MFSTRSLSVAVQWLALIGLSAAIALAMEYSQLPAAVMIGSLIAGIIVSIGGGTVTVPQAGFSFAQSIAGCLIAASLSPAMFPVLAKSWPTFVVVIISTVMASNVLGLALSRWKILPGTAGVWGAAPGASTAMVLMAGAFGDDQQLVAFMQYLRVIIVSIGAAMIASLWVDTDAIEPPHHNWFPTIEVWAFATTIIVAVAGSRIGRRVLLPLPHFLGALVLGTFLRLVFDVGFQIPEWLVAMSFATIGWTIGLKFQNDTLWRAARILPQIVLSILVLMAFCGGIAFVLVEAMGIDPLTAYLATTPGGMDTVAIVAIAAGNVDISFVMTMQALRFMFVLFAGPPIARLVASWARD